MAIALPARRRRLVVYVAGPYRDPRGMYYVDKNVNEAREVAAQLWAWDFSVICPHTNTRFLDGYEGISDDAFLEGDLDQIERVDALVLMPRWKTSVGSVGEHAYAKELGLPVLFWQNEKDRALLKFLGPEFLRDPYVLERLPESEVKHRLIAATST
jgi:hypothetical protein